MKVINPILLLSLFALASYSYADANPSDLIKVTDKIKEKCVVYYTRNHELYCSTKALSSSHLPSDITSYEKQNIVFDDRTWKLVWGKKTDKSITTEYVPLGDDIDSWNELITSQYFSQIPDTVTPKQFADLAIEGIKKLGLKPTITFHQESPDLVIFEFQIDKPESQVQDEIQIIRKKSDGFYVLHYVIRKSDMGKENRDKWIARFLKSK